MKQSGTNSHTFLNLVSTSEKQKLVEFFCIIDITMFIGPFSSTKLSLSHPDLHGTHEQE
jgi:hypothetical protein